ncbi:MAG: hypothetical protein ACR2QM_01280 [Longimicrobiales bacterium]
MVAAPDPFAHHRFMLPRPTAPLLTTLALGSLAAWPAAGQSTAASGALGEADALERHHPALYALVGRLEQAHAALFDELARQGPADSPDETDNLLISLVRDPNPKEMANGYGVLGPRAAEVIRWGQAFQREVLSVLADPDVEDRSATLAAAVGRYQSRPEAALPTVPKDMDTLYGHPYALGLRTRFPDLDGVAWAGHWLRLAATEPLTDLPPGPERTAGVDTVAARYDAKLSYGEPPQSFPTEIPLAPAIAPGLIWLSPESAMIWDNLSMMLEVLGDGLASAEAANVPQVIEATIDFFLDPELASTDQDEWEIMALRHGIFFQGGFPLSVMTENERNVGGHAAHGSGGRMLMTIPGMPIG